MEYKLMLPDLYFVITTQHKLIPSVIGDMIIQKKVFSGSTVTYSGLTYCAMRCANHSGSTDYHQLQDMKRIRSLDIFNGSCINPFSPGKIEIFNF